MSPATLVSLSGLKKSLLLAVVLSQGLVSRAVGMRYYCLSVSTLMEIAMSTSMIAGNLAASSPNQAAYQPVKSSPPANDPSASLAAAALVANPILSNKVTAAAKQAQAAGVSGPAKPARAMSHVVEVYNIHGKVRTKFLDSHNNLIYQIPSEMKAKMEDLMMKPETAADTKA